jgi:hypothetical protein
MQNAMPKFLSLLNLLQQSTKSQVNTIHPLTPSCRAHLKVVDQYLQFLFIGPQRRANCEPVL